MRTYRHHSCTVSRVWWEYALWGLLGAASNRGLRFVEDLHRVKGWPWARAVGGPGAGPYVAATGVHLFLGAAAAAALTAAGIVDNAFLAFCAGVGAVLVVKKAGELAAGQVPSGGRDDGYPQRGSDQGSPDQGDARPRGRGADDAA